jgi:hypothetical protein
MEVVHRRWGHRPAVFAARLGDQVGECIAGTTNAIRRIRGEFDVSEPREEGVDLYSGGGVTEVGGAKRGCGGPGKRIENSNPSIRSRQDFGDKLHGVRRRKTKPTVPPIVAVELEG